MKRIIKLLASIVVLLLAAFAIAAPVPKAKPKEPPAPSVIGTWECRWATWGDWDSEMRFRADGGYHHRTGSGTLWVGTWWRAGDGSLVVRERCISSDPAASPGSWIHWHTTDETWAGASLDSKAGGGHGNLKWGLRNRKPEGK